MRVTKEIHDKLCKELVDSGRLIEAGFVGFRNIVIHPDAPEAQVNEMHMAFMAGAQHLYGSIMGIMDADKEPTQNDMRRMAAIDTELRAFAKSLKLRLTPAKGSG